MIPAWIITVDRVALEIMKFRWKQPISLSSVCLQGDCQCLKNAYHYNQDNLNKKQAQHHLCSDSEEEGDH